MELLPNVSHRTMPAIEMHLKKEVKKKEKRKEKKEINWLFQGFFCIRFMFSGVVPSFQDVWGEEGERKEEKDISPQGRAPAPQVTAVLRPPRAQAPALQWPRGKA